MTWLLTDWLKIAELVRPSDSLQVKNLGLWMVSYLVRTMAAETEQVSSTGMALPWKQPILSVRMWRTDSRRAKHLI